MSAIFESALRLGKALREIDAVGRRPFRERLRFLFAKVYPAATVSAVAVLWLWTSADRRRFQEIRDGGAWTMGRVIWSDPAWNGRFGYEFSIGSRRYSGSSAGSFSAGASVEVKFASGDPEASCVCDPAAELRRARMIPLIAGFWIGAGIPVLLAVLLQARLGK